MKIVQSTVQHTTIGKTNWSLLNAIGDVPWDMLHFGLEDGDSWVAAEVNTSIRPEWFYHPSEDNKVKTVPKLIDTYYNSIGHNATLLLNFSIMPNGLIHPTDEKMAIEFGKAVTESFAVNLAKKTIIEASNVRGNANKFDAAKAIDNNKNSYWATDDSVTIASLTIDFGKPTLFNRFMAQEYIRLGQRVKSFSLEAFVDGNWKEVANTTTIGYKRILRFPSVEATQVRFNIIGSKSCPVISNIGVYNAPVFLNAPTITRNQSGEVSINTNDIGPIFYYSLDGSEPTTESKQYTRLFVEDGKVEIRLIAYDHASVKSGSIGLEKFDISKKIWKIPEIDDKETSAIIDGNPNTVWHQSKDKKMPVGLLIDLGTEQNLSGFKYLPDQSRWSWGILNEGKLTNKDGKGTWWEGLDLQKLYA